MNFNGQFRFLSTLNWILTYLTKLRVNIERLEVKNLGLDKQNIGLSLKAL